MNESSISLATVAAAVQAERLRILGILDSPEAQGREKLARTLAENPNITPAVARKLLTAAAQSQSGPNRGSELARLMAQVGNPQVGVDGDDLPAPRTLSPHAIFRARNEANGL